jgi:hypothetical protein
MPWVQEIFKITFGNIGLILVVPDGTIDFVIAEKFHVVDIIEIILNALSNTGRPHQRSDR